MATVVCQKWLESEQGWGQRDDGYSLHLTEADRVAYCKEYWETMPKEVPAEYSREDGGPRLLDIPTDEKTYKDLFKSKNGIRLYGDLCGA